MNNNTPMTSDFVKKALALKHSEDFYMTECKNGPTWGGGHLRLDAVALKKSWSRPCVTGYEVKVSRNDFLSDSKWPEYLQYCNRFYFACPCGLIKKEELPDSRVGLIYVREDGSTYTAKAIPMRPVDIPVEFYIYIIFSKLESDRTPFYTEKSQYWRDWVANKFDNRRLGANVKSKMVSEIERLEKELRDRDSFDCRAEDYKAILEVMSAHDIRTTYNPAERLKEYLNRGYTESLDDAEKTLKYALERIEKIKAKCGHSELYGEAEG